MKINIRGPVRLSNANSTQPTGKTKPMKKLFVLTSFLLAGVARADIPYASALDAAAVVQTPMAQEIPGSLILGNGDLNGILWIHQGKLRFTITKNDICD